MTIGIMVLAMCLVFLAIGFYVQYKILHSPFKWRATRIVVIVMWLPLLTIYYLFATLYYFEALRSKDGDDL